MRLSLIWTAPSLLRNASNFHPSSCRRFLKILWAKSSRENSKCLFFYPVKIGIFNFFLEIRDVVTRRWSTPSTWITHTHTHTHIYIYLYLYLYIYIYIYIYIYQSCLFTEYFVFHDRALWTLFLTHFSFSLQQLEKQLSFTPSVQLLLLANSLFSADRTEYPDAGAAVGRMQWWYKVRREGNETVYWQTRERKRRSHSVQPEQ